MRSRLVILILCLSILAGCSIPTEPAREKIYNIDTDPLPFSDEELFSLLFDIKNKITLRLDMDDLELTKMQQDYNFYNQWGSKSPIYRKGDLTITVMTPNGRQYSFYIEEVGVRMKGNTSRTDFYSPSEGIYNIIHLKLSFQETFDDPQHYGSTTQVWNETARDLRRNRTFATLEKLDLRWNRCDDGTYLKEYFAYETYRQYGVLAPHTNLTSFDWAGIHMGVFTINEPVDSIFLEKNLPQSALGGDLYKCGWGGSSNGSFVDTNSIGIENEVKGEFYAYDLKTNKKTSTHQALTTLINQLNTGTVTKEDFAQLVDLENFLPFAAVSYLLGNPDDMRNNYNNFYVYFRGDNNKAVFIPYDYDRCLGITAHWNPTRTGVTDDNPFSAELMSADRYDPNANRTQDNPIILYSVAAGGYYVQEYAQLLSEISQGDWFRYETFEELYLIAKANYNDLTTPGKAFYNTNGLYLSFDIDRTSDFSSNGNISVREYLDAKLKTLNSYLTNTETYANGKPQIMPTWYIRGSFTDWQKNDRYIMTESSGCYQFRIDAPGRVELKVYNTKTDAWYGSECVTKDCLVQYQTDGYTNIVLEKGSYWVIFDPSSLAITLKFA